MNVFEFILLILGIFSLIHYISYSLFRAKNYIAFATGIYKENQNVYLIRTVELALVLINIGIWIYKLIF